MESKYRFCQDCNAPCSKDLKKDADLKNSGLVIYVHKRKDSLKWSTERCRRSDEAFILHNASFNESKKTELTGESRHQAKCFQCRRVVQRVRSLLDELTEIRDNQILGVCEHCRRSKRTNKCPRCDYILKKFLSDKVRQCEERQRRFKVWLCRVRHLLQAIIDGGNVCQHRTYQDTDSNIELKNLLQQLKVPLAVHEPTCEFFPVERDLASLQNLTESKEIIDELIIKLQNEQPHRLTSDNSLYPFSSKMCICKYFTDKKFDGVLPELDVSYQPKKDGESEKIGSADQRSTGKMYDLKSMDEKQRYQERSKTGSAGQSFKGMISTDKTHKSRGIISSDEKSKVLKKGKSQSLGEKPLKRSSKKTHKQGSISADELTIQSSLKDRGHSKKGSEKRHQSTAMTEEDKIFLKLIKEYQSQKHDKQVGTSHKRDKDKRAARMTDLPSLKRREHKSARSLVTESESFMECGDYLKERPEMIKDIKIVPYDPHYKDDKRTTRVPLLFEIYSPDYACPEPEPPAPIPASAEDVSASLKAPSLKSAPRLSSEAAFTYTLSDRKFIDSGITKLPTEKVMRKMNVYKMLATHPSWFDRNKAMTKYYNTGEILAEINEDGSGKWFYKNGVVALDYHYTDEPNAIKRYVVYSAGKDLETCKFKRQTVLASFDFLGNGVVYDHSGNIRLKYNQSEGLIADEKISPRGKWKWHTLNDPPVLQRLYINTNLKRRDPILELFHEMQHKNTEEISQIKQEQEALMLTIELDNYVKEKANKMLQEFKPFEIRMKAVKINDQFSLKILDQANIRLYFRDGATSLKLNIGMSLISDEIVDTTTAEVSEVATPYDKRPPKTKSVANIQRMIDGVRKEGKTLSGSEW